MPDDCQCTGDAFAWCLTDLVPALLEIMDKVAYSRLFNQRLLGLAQENSYFDNMTYDSYGRRTGARIRIYSNAASVGTASNVVATYQMAATYDSQGRLSTYEMVKQ